MKSLKYILLSVLCCTVYNCNDDDPTQDELDRLLFPTENPVNFSVDPIIQIDAILALPPGSDISTLIDFGQGPSVSAAEFESVVRLEDIVIFGQPSGLQNDDALFYDLDFNIILDNDEVLTPNDQIIQFGTRVVNTVNIDAIVGGQNIETESIPVSGEPILSQIGISAFVEDETEDLIFKYDMECWIRRNDVLNGPYIIDPKIRVKSRDFSDN